MSTRGPIALKLLIALPAVLATLAVAAPDEPSSAAPGRDPGDGPAVRQEAIKVEGEWLGTASPEEVARYPGARTVLDGPALRRSGARNLEEALRQAPGVQVRDETGLGILPNIGVRGLNPLRSERVMVLVDGIPLALAPYTGTGVSLFPVTPEMVDRIDVARGGIAVRYGPNNVGGVVNILTEPIARGAGTDVRQRLTIAESTGRVFSDTYASLGTFATPDLGLRLQAHLQSGHGERDHSKTDVGNLQLDGIWFPDGRSELEGRLQYYKADAELPGALSPAAFEADATRSQRPFDAFLGETWRGSLAFRRFSGEDAEFGATVFAHGASREFAFAQPFDPALPTTSVSTSPRDFRVAGIEPRQTWRLRTGGLTHTVTVGGRYVREEVDFIVDNRALATGAVTRPRDWRFETDAFAAYASDTLGLPGGRLEVTPGIRYEHVATDFLNNQNGAANRNRSREALPGLAVGYRATPAVFLFANAHRSLRPPQVAQVTLFGGDVASEVAWDYEAGGRIQAASALELSAAGFLIDFDDQIEFDRGTLSFRNLGRTRHRGFELEARWRPPALPGALLAANYTRVDAEQRSGAHAGRDVPFASRDTLNVSGSYARGPARLALNGFYQGEAFADAANTVAESANGAVGLIPSYWVWNAALTYELRLDGRRLTLGIAANNLFGERYFFRGIEVSPIGRVPAPGRAFLVSIEAQL